MHAVAIGKVNLDALLGLAAKTRLEEDSIKAVRFLRDPTCFTGIADFNPADSSCSLNLEQVQLMIDRGFYVKVAIGDKMRGVVRAFMIPEPWKVPPRQRVIHWTYSINALDDQVRPALTLLSQRDVRFLVWSGSHGVSIDGKAAFNQFPNSKEVGLYQCIQTPLGWVWLAVMAMGVRYACFVAEITLRVICLPCRCSNKPYIDNVHLGGSPDDLMTDLAIIRERSGPSCVNYTWNEDLSDPSSLIKEVVDFLGLTLNHRTKCVRLVDKVLQKLATVWSRVNRWTFRDFVVAVSILSYMSAATGSRVGRWSKILRLWARAQGLAAVDRTIFDLTFEWPDLASRDMMEAWVLQALKNDWCYVPEQDLDEDFLMITDASADMWCGIVISLKSGQCTVLNGRWPESFQAYVHHSAYAEPLAVAAAVNTFFYPGTTASIRHVGDNTGNQGTINKGYSTKPHQILMEYLQTDYPGLSFRADYWEGASIPADGPSRGLPLDQAKLQELVEFYKVEISDIRDFTLNS
jgi:hypothetical protein